MIFCATFCILFLLILFLLYCHDSRSVTIAKVIIQAFVTSHYLRTDNSEIVEPSDKDPGSKESKELSDTLFVHFISGYILDIYILYYVMFLHYALQP
jgi:hypothetical protein